MGRIRFPWMRAVLDRVKGLDRFTDERCPFDGCPSRQWKPRSSGT